MEDENQDLSRLIMSADSTMYYLENNLTEDLIREIMQQVIVETINWNKTMILQQTRSRRTKRVRIGIFKK